MFWPPNSAGHGQQLGLCFNLAVEIYVLASPTGTYQPLESAGFQSRGRDLCFGLPATAPRFAFRCRVSISRSRFMFWPLARSVSSVGYIASFQSRGRDLCFGLKLPGMLAHITTKVSISRSRFMFWPPNCDTLLATWQSKFQSRGRDLCFGLRVRPEGTILISMFQSRGRDLCFGLRQPGDGGRGDNPVSISRSRFMFWPHNLHISGLPKIVSFNLAVEIYVLASDHSAASFIVPGVFQSRGRDLCFGLFNISFETTVRALFQSRGRDLCFGLITLLAGWYGER